MTDIRTILFCTPNKLPCLWPVNAQNHQQVGGQDVATGPHHHQGLAGEVVGVPLQHNLACNIALDSWWGNLLLNNTACFTQISATHPNGGSPDCLHGEGDEGGDGVCHGEVEHKVVNISPNPSWNEGNIIFSTLGPRGMTYKILKMCYCYI